MAHEKSRMTDRFCFSHGGVLASTWVLKHKEHTGADEDLVKNVHFVIGNDYALAA